MVDKPSIPSLPGLKPKPEPPMVKPPTIDNTLPGRTPPDPTTEFPPVIEPVDTRKGAFLRPRVNPLSPRPPEDIAAAQKVFDDSVTALAEAKASRDERNIPLSDGYWGAVDAHRKAYLALKDSILELPIAPKPDSDMLHDFVEAVKAINAGQPQATAMSSMLTGTISIPVDNVPEEYLPFIRAQIPLGIKLVTAVEQPVEDAVIELTPPVIDPEPIP